jgi:hypothetical protein
VVARVFGRALDKDGMPVADTVRQEHYVEDRFHVPVTMQAGLAEALADAGAKRFRIASDLARLLVSHAYLGQLDVNPLGSPGGQGSLKQSEFWAQKVGVEGGQGPVQIRVEGRSEALGRSFDHDVGDGRLWRHEVKLVWEGLIEMQEGRMTRLLLLARGPEKLKWDNQDPDFKQRVDVARLLLGHPIDLDCQARFGFIGEPIAADEAATEAPARTRTDSVAQVPDEGPAHLAQALGPAFVVFRDKVQEEIKLSQEQKQKLGERFQETVQDAMQFFQKLDGLKPEAREKELGSYREKAQEKLATFLKRTLKLDQLTRLWQLERQQQGLFALGQPEIGKELKISDKQRNQFVAVVQEMERQIQPLMKEAQSGGNPQEIMPKVMKIRQDHEGKIEAILTDSQKKQWQEMLGKRLDLGD